MIACSTAPSSPPITSSAAPPARSRARARRARLLAVVSGLALRGLPHASAMAAAQGGGRGSRAGAGGRTGPARGDGQRPRRRLASPPPPAAAPTTPPPTQPSAISPSSASARPTILLSWRSISAPTPPGITPARFSPSMAASSPACDPRPIDASPRALLASPRSARHVSAGPPAPRRSRGHHHGGGPRLRPRHGPRLRRRRRAPGLRRPAPSINWRRQRRWVRAKGRRALGRAD